VTTRPPASESCLTDELMVRLVEGLLGEKERRDMLAHVDLCHGCRELVATAAGAIDSGEALEESTELVRGALVGRFVVVDRVGVGATAEVHVAYDPKLDRKVGLKLLRPSPSAPEYSPHSLEKRLVREAQALARLSHPNVVPVFDVGMHGDRVFVAMEYVEGTTLRTWLARPRAWRDALAMFIQAGRGLAAAHAVGIIHRDFKPENVLVGADDRPRVADFGLATASGEDVASAGSATGSGGSPDLAQTLTQTGSVLGTPAYMAPEQLCGDRATAASDQFAFCVALYEALYGDRPFGGDTLPQLLNDIETGRVRPPARGGRVPRRVLAAVMRGLASSPASRFPSMQALLAALAPHPMRPRVAVAIAVPLAVLVAAAGMYAMFFAGAPAHEAACHRGSERLAGVWDEARKRGLHDAFRRSGARGADVTWTSFSAVLDQRARAWAAMQDEACEATHVRGVQSPAILDLRTECLERRRQEMRELVDVYIDRPAAESVDRAVLAADKLPSVSACADIANLRAVVPLPDDPTARARVQSLRRRLSHLLALRDAGAAQRGPESIETLAREIGRVGYAPLAAEVAQARAIELSLAGKLDEGDQAFLDAARLAVLGRDGKLEAGIWVSLVAHYGRAGRVREGLVTGRVAELAVLRANGDDVLRGRLANNIGTVESAAGHVEAAVRHFKEAEVLWRKQAGTSYLYTTILDNIGSNLVTLGRTREARGYLERALAIQRSTLRPDHPEIARTLSTIGDAQLILGKLREASASFAAALAIRRQELGPDHEETAYSVMQVAQTESSLGNHDRAFELLDSAIAVWERDEQNIYLGTLYVVLADSQRRAGRDDKAERTLQKVIEHDTRAGSPEHANTGQALIMLGHIDNDRRRYQRALERCRRGIDLILRDVGQATGSQLDAGDCIGEALIALGDVDGAVRALERALSAGSLEDLGPQWSSGARFQLARALWSTPASRPRARELASSTLKALAAGEGDNHVMMARIEAWIRTRGDAPGPVVRPSPARRAVRPRHPR
jgi:tetratricopeptide (TPR) repeat protein